MSTVVRTHPGDAFAQAYRYLDNESDTALDALDEQIDTGLAPLVDAVVEHVTTRGVMPSLAPANRGSWYAILIGLDRVLGPLDPARGGVRVPDALKGLRAQLRNRGRLDTGACDGAVLSRCATPGRPGGDLDGLAGRLGSLIYVPQAEWDAVDLWRPRHDLPRPVSGGLLDVAAVPYFGRRADVTATPRPSGPQLRYSVEPAATLDRRTRVQRALTALDDSGAVLGLVPEATLDTATLAEWTAALASRRGTGRLKWLLVGTGAVDVTADAATRLAASATTWSPSTTAARNRAVLLNRNGRVVLTQDKQHGFTLVASTVKNWHLDDQLPCQNISEWLDSPRTLNVLETSQGRLVILICEDLTRASTVGRIAAAVGASVAIAPIFGAVITEPTTPVRGKGPEWPQQGAAALAIDVGARTVVLNSMAITRVFHGTSDPSVTLFTVRPDPTRHSYWTDYRVGKPTGGVNTVALSALDDAVTARVADV